MSKDKITTEVWIIETRPDKPPPPESEQAIDAERRTIIAKLEGGQALTTHESIRAAGALKEFWLPREHKMLKARRKLESIEQTLETAKQIRKHRLPFPLKGTPLEYVADTYGFASAGALKQWLKRARPKNRRR